MTNNSKLYFIKILRFLFLSFYISFIMFCTLTLNTSAREDSPRVIKVGVFPYEDQMKLDAEGNYSGYGYDYLQELSRYTGWHYEFVTGSWNDCLSMLEHGEIDLLGAVMRSPEREKIYDFSNNPMISGYGVLVTSQDNASLPYEDFQAFKGLKVGGLKGNLQKDLFLSYSKSHDFTTAIQEYDTQKEMEDALASGEVNAIIMTNLLHSDTLRVIATFGDNEAYFATTKGNASVLLSLNEAMQKIRLNDPYFNNKLDQKYYNLQATTAISFTQEELNFIKKCPPVPCVYIPAAVPISYYDASTGTVEGVAVDVCKILEERTGLTFHWIHPSSASEAAAMLSKGEALLIPAKYYDSNWAEQNNVMLTDPYLLGQMMMVTGRRTTESDVVALYDQGSQSRLVANVVSGGAELKQYDTIIDCMDAVLNGNANATFINSTIASYLVNNPKYAQLQITPLYGFSADVSMAVSGKADPLLLSVINKGIRNISATEVNQIVLSQMKTGQAGPVATYLYLHPVESVSTVTVLFAILVSILLILLYLLSKSAKKMQKTLYTDSLTGYPNYSALSREAPALTARNPENYALVYLDIHHFKVINDTFGYDAGDRVLTAVSDTIWNCLSYDERAARIYADTFVMLLRYTGHDVFKDRLNELSDRLSQISFQDQGAINPLFCGGVYPLPSNFDNLDKACDRANYAKDSISQYFFNTFVFYDDIMRNRVLAEKELEGSMQSALEHKEFIPYYQPKVNAITEKVVGAEALVRWQHPEKGLLPPGEFLPFYEENGFIVKIDLFIFEQVCRDMHNWLEKGNQAIPVSVNFSRRHMRDSSLPGKLKSITEQYHIPPALLEVEVTETEELENMETAVEFVDTLKAYGFGISIDDYGTGYSSISFLQQLPLDALKLDRKFILNAMKTDKARDLMRYLVTAMQKNGIRVVCEGIETDEQRDFIIGQNCRYIQGYRYSTPISREDFELYLKEHGLESSHHLDYISVTDFERNHWTGAEGFIARSLPSWVVSAFTEPGYPIHYISPGFLEGMGYSELEFMVATSGLYNNWVHPDDLPLLSDNLEQNKDSVLDLSLQYRLRKKNGEYVWIQDLSKRVLIDDGREVLLSVCTNITNIVNLETEKSRLIDAIPGGVGELLLTENGPVIQNATNRFYEIIGHSREEMAALQYNLFSILCEQDIQHTSNSLNHFMDSSTPYCDCIFRVRHQNGKLHWVSFRGTISHLLPDRQATVIIYNNDDEMQAKQSAETDRAKLELAMKLTGQAVFEYDIQSETIYSHSGFPMFGISDITEINLKRNVIEESFIHPEDVSILHTVLLRIATGEVCTSNDIRIRSRNTDNESPYIWVRITLSTIFDENHIPVRAVGVVDDINKQKLFENSFLQETQYRRAFTESSLMAYEINLTKDTIQRITGSRGFRLQELCSSLKHPDCYSELLQTATEVLVYHDDRADFSKGLSRENLLKLFKEGITEKELEYRRLTLDGQELWNSVLIYLLLDQLSGDVIGYAYHRDIHERKANEKDLMEQAARDPLTGIYNRATCEHLIQNFLLQDADPGKLQVFLMLDMDHFKEINDTCGHLTGDKCLIRLAQLIKEQVRVNDIVARMGGDEFAVLLKNLPDKKTAVTVAEKLNQSVKQIGVELEMSLQTSVSIGISVSKSKNTDFEKLYSRADQAMYEAKRKVDSPIIISKQ